MIQISRSMSSGDLNIEELSTCSPEKRNHQTDLNISCLANLMEDKTYKAPVLKINKPNLRQTSNRTSRPSNSSSRLANDAAAGFAPDLPKQLVRYLFFKRRNNETTVKRLQLGMSPHIRMTSIFTILTLITLEVILLSTVSSCAKTFYMHWNTSNSIFRIDNTDHIIDVNKGNLAFEFDQVHIICPVYEPGTYENETEKYIIYNVSKVEYETCRITNADPRVIAICDKPQKLMFFTITFRPFTPQPGGLEFLPGNDYYFISTSSKDDLYRRIGGRCSTNNMKVVFKVCCAPEEKNKTSLAPTTNLGETAISRDEHIDSHAVNNQDKHHINTLNNFGTKTGGGVGSVGGGGISVNTPNVHNNGIQLKPVNVGAPSTSINTNIDQINRIPTNGINIISNNVDNGHLGVNGGIMLSSGDGRSGINMIHNTGVTNSGQYHPNFGIGQYIPGQATGIRINNVPPHQYPPQKIDNSDDHNSYGKHPNEVVKNEELTYTSSGISLHRFNPFMAKQLQQSILKMFNHKSSSSHYAKKKFLYFSNFIVNFNPTLLLTILLVIFTRTISHTHVNSSVQQQGVIQTRSVKSKASYSAKNNHNFISNKEHFSEICRKLR